MVYERGIMEVSLLTWSFVLGASGAFFMSRYAFRFGLVDLPNARSSHSLPTPRGGGVGILAAFIISAFALDIPAGLWVPAALLAVVSFFDDSLDLSPKTRLFFQFLAAAFVVFFVGVNGSIFFVSLFLMIFFAIYIVGTANFYNFMDGINGIAGITGVTGFILIALFASISGSDHRIVLLALCIAAGCLGFLPFNLPEAKVFMGDVGSVLLGFLFASMVVWLASDISSFICLASFLAPFYIDSLTAIFIRWRNGDKLFKAHRRHLYQLLANELGHPHWIISLVYGGLQVLTGLLMLWAWNRGLLTQLIVIVLLSISFIFVSWRIRIATCELSD